MGSRDQSLAEVIRIIPERCYENPDWKGLLFFARDVAVYAAVLAALAATDAWWLLIPLWVLAGLCVSALFILGHDSAHGSLFRSRRLCYAVGQTAMLPALHVYEAWVLGHNRLHHGHTVREQLDFVWHPLSPDQYAALSPVAKLRHRLEWSLLGAGIYYLRDVWWNKMVRLDPPAKMAPAIDRDWRIVASFAAIATLALAALGGAAYGSVAGALWMWLKLLIVPWLLFNWIIGWTVYVHHIDERIPWHRRREWTKFKGQMEGTTILRVPRALDFFFHGIFLHVPHHVDMRIPFYGLPAAAEAILAHYPDVVEERPLRLRDYLAAVRSCKLFDFERGVWLTYAEARSRRAVEAAA
jgi:omega-6 fatty acid desaturase (delta-12 desaturase)